MSLPIIEEFEKYLQKKNLRDSTLQAYVINVNAFIKEDTSISVTKIISYLNRINAKKTIGRYLKTYAEFLYKRKELSLEEFEEIKELSLTNDSPKRTLKTNDNTKLDINYKFAVPIEQWDKCYLQLEYLPQRMGLWLGFNYGLRKQEICNLKWSDINLKVNKITIRDSEPDNFRPKGFKVKTKNAIRTIPITPKQKLVLEDYLKQTKELNLQHNYLIYSLHHRFKFQPITKAAIDEWCKRVTIPVVVDGYSINRKINPHCLRWSFSTLIYTKNGLQCAYYLSKILGHAEVKNIVEFNSTTQKYIVMDENELYKQELQIMINAGL